MNPIKIGYQIYLENFKPSVRVPKPLGYNYFVSFIQYHQFEYGTRLLDVLDMHFKLPRLFDKDGRLLGVIY